jgi:ribosomal protein L11 methyltransferase
MKNATDCQLQPIQITLQGEADFLAILEEALEPFALAITNIVSPELSLQILLEADMREMAENLIATLRVQTPSNKLQMQVQPLVPIDWVAKVQADFPAFSVDRYYVFSSQKKNHIPRNQLGLCIDAVSAFGTGEHETTAGCLHGMAAIYRQKPAIKRVLDMGCGTAILAIAAAKTWKMAKVLAFDNDTKAVEVSQHNIVVNRVHSRVQAGYSDGFKHAVVEANGYFDLVIANILAWPLKMMAPAAVRCVKPGGMLLLSGILNSQVNLVAHAYQKQKLQLISVQHYGKWSVLTLQKPLKKARSY